LRNSAIRSLRMATRWFRIHGWLAHRFPQQNLRFICILWRYPQCAADQISNFLKALEIASPSLPNYVPRFSEMNKGDEVTQCKVNEGDVEETSFCTYYTIRIATVQVSPIEKLTNGNRSSFSSITSLTNPAIGPARSYITEKHDCNERREIPLNSIRVKEYSKRIWFMLWIKVCPLWRSPRHRWSGHNCERNYVQIRILEGIGSIWSLPWGTVSEKFCGDLRHYWNRQRFRRTMKPNDHEEPELLFRL
jgi:hypothetical protein